MIFPTSKGLKRNIYYFKCYLVKRMPCVVGGVQRCDDTNNFLEIDGFTCPGGETIGPQVKQEPVPTQNGAKISADFYISP
jgi:hypothetical protein